MTFKRLMTALWAVWLVGTIAWIPPALAADTANGAKLFELHCAGCHAQGGNIVRRGKNLKLKALQRNQVDTVAAIVTLVANGKANMPAYKNRLSAAEIEDVSVYVFEQAQQGWH